MPRELLMPDSSLLFSAMLYCSNEALPHMCAPIGRSQHRAIIVLCFARIAVRTDTRPVRSARASPSLDAYTAAHFSTKSDGRARCATFYAWLRRCVLHGSSFRHVRRMLRFATHPVADKGQAAGR